MRKLSKNIYLKKQLKYEQKQASMQREAIIISLGRNYRCLTQTQQLLLCLAIIGAVTPIIHQVYENTNSAIPRDPEVNRNKSPQKATANDKANSKALVLYNSFAASNQTALATNSFLTANNSTKVSSPATKTEDPSSYYKGIPIKDISLTKRNCSRKMMGHSKGEVCTLDNKKYHMKSFDDPHQNWMLGAYNLKFLKNNVGITVPEPLIFSNAGTFHFASEDLKDFVPASTLKTTNPNLYRENLVGKIGEHGIAKFMVALTFIDDLKPENWGYDKNGLVLIDVDIAPRTPCEFSSRSGQINSHGLPLSVNNIKEMRTIYNEMLTKPLPSIDPSVDLSADTYREVLQTYIRCCDSIVENGLKDFPSLTSNTPSWQITKEFQRLIEELTNTAKSDKHMRGRK